MIQINDLTICDDYGRGIVTGVDLDIPSGRIHAVVGESGSGKTTLGIALMGAIRPGLHLHRGTIKIGSTQPLELTARQLRDFRRERVAWVGQDPALSLTPWHRVRRILGESLESADASDAELLAHLDQVGLGGSVELLDRLPGQLSGGQRRRVAIARALVRTPDLLILDESSSGLDPQAVANLEATISAMHEATNTTIILITHDLAFARRLAMSMSVMKDGALIESGTSSELLSTPRADATRRLIRAHRLQRSPSEPLQRNSPELLRLRDWEVAIHRADRVLGPLQLTLHAGEGLAITGASGAGKSTLAHSIIGTHPARRGTIEWQSHMMPLAFAARDARWRRGLQLITQDPAASLNPALTVKAHLVRALQRTGRSTAQIHARLPELLKSVNLDEELLQRRPPHLSGGQAQRVAIARALAHDPQVLICDESTSALDATIQLEILDTLNSLRRELDLALVMITHSPDVARYTCERQLVLNQDASGHIEATQSPLRPTALATSTFHGDPS